MIVAMMSQIAIVHAEDFSWMKISVIPQCTVQYREDGYRRICSELLEQGEIEEVKGMQFADVLAYKAVENGLILPQS